MTERPIGFYIKKINDEFYKRMNKDLKSYNITTSQMLFLILLHLHHGSMPMKELQTRLHISQPTMAGIASRLVVKKMVTLSIDPDDRRNKIVSETGVGIKLWQCLRKKGQQANQELLGALSQTEQDELRKLLKKVFDSIK